MFILGLIVGVVVGHYWGQYIEDAIKYVINKVKKN